MQCRSKQYLFFMFALLEINTCVLDWIITGIHKQQLCFLSTNLSESSKVSQIIVLHRLSKILNCGIEIRYLMTLRVKETRLTKINSTHEDMYKALPRYAEDILHTNHNSMGIVECYRELPQCKFKWIFVCYCANAMGFPHRLPILRLDGTHLKSKYSWRFSESSFWYVSPQVISLASDRCALASAFINSGQSGDITDATVPFWPIRRYYALWGHAIGDRGAAFSSCIWGSSKLS